MFWVWALNALQNSMILTPRWPSAGPTGGEGLACPAVICNFTCPTTFFATDQDSAAGPARLKNKSSSALAEPPGSSLFDLDKVQLYGRGTAENRDQDPHLALLRPHLFNRTVKI